MLPTTPTLLDWSTLAHELYFVIRSFVRWCTGLRHSAIGRTFMPH